MIQSTVYFCNNSFNKTKGLQILSFLLKSCAFDIDMKIITPSKKTHFAVIQGVGHMSFRSLVKVCNIAIVRTKSSQLLTTGSILSSDYKLACCISTNCPLQSIFYVVSNQCSENQNVNFYNFLRVSQSNTHSNPQYLFFYDTCIHIQSQILTKTFFSYTISLSLHVFKLPSFFILKMSASLGGIGKN